MAGMPMTVGRTHGTMASDPASSQAHGRCAPKTVGHPAVTRAGPNFRR